MHQCNDNSNVMQKSNITVIMQDIPKKFATNIIGHIAEEVKLEVPSGKIYYVKIAKEQNDLVFGSGWETFASAYDLTYGDFLVFAYTEHSHFKVRIFDRSCCEKECSCVLTDGIPRVQQRGVSQDNHMQSPVVERLAKHCIGSSSQSKKSSKTSPTNSPLQNSTEDDPSSEHIREPLNSGGFQKPTRCCFVLPTGYKMTNEQNTQIDALVHKIRPQIPLYVTAMEKTTAAGGFLAMAKNYVLKYLLDENGTITLCLPQSSKKWAINVDIKTDGRYALSSGWLNFIHDNRLQEGDICIFQPSKGNDNMALIFYPLEESFRPQPPGYVPSTKSPRHGVTKPSYMAPRFTTLDGQQEREVIKKIGKINSDIPIYVAIMQKSNISRTLCMLVSYHFFGSVSEVKEERSKLLFDQSTTTVSSIVISLFIFSICNQHFGFDYARTYLPHGNHDIRLRRPNKDNTWKGELRYYDRRPTLGRCWRQFVADNKLKLGDICLFQLMKDMKNLTMSVHIIRKERFS
ncbi:hypothetical protein PR202_gb24104 [Eleusine coracana subsp. coracana]|uniref:TF-B3 domain-containing protein n=1 Tax=Eleusine coracana subsp. coracana TaxID=191504 RepID=A0AAV5FKN2_ELECO|nr:hypothetical protein PR202_gb24104 [Eleusine coracana subsp. coracana]